MERNARFELTVHSFLPTMGTGSEHETHLCIPLKPVISIVLRDIPKLIDEPTTYLDVRYQLQILKLIQKLNREYGITIVMVLHDINQSLYYSDEIVAMKDGRMIAHGLPEEIITKELVQEVYGVDLTIQSVDGKPFVIPV